MKILKLLNENVKLFILLGVHRSISATNSKPSTRRSSAGGESLRESIASHAAGAQLTVICSVDSVSVSSLFYVQYNFTFLFQSR